MQNIDFVEHQKVANSVTIKDVARLAEVSIGTVSRVFNNHSNVNKEIQQRVLKAAAELGYFRSTGQGSHSQSGGRTLKEIGFLLSLGHAHDDKEPIAPFWANILHGAEIEARASNIKVTYQAISSRGQTAYSLLTKLYEMRLGGLLLVGPAASETIDVIQSTKIPMVLVDNYIRRKSLDAVLSDNYGGAMEAVNYLIGEGHRQIAFIGGPTQSGPRPVNELYTIKWRATGYRTALLDAGLPINDALIETCNLSPEDSYKACKRLIASKTKFSAIFCANDPAAIGVLKALRDAGLRVPEDVSVVGFDDDMAEHLTPALTTIRVDKEAMGGAAVKALIARANNPQAVSVTSILGVELIKRASVTSYHA